MLAGQITLSQRLSALGRKSGDVFCRWHHAAVFLACGMYADSLARARFRSVRGADADSGWPLVPLPPAYREVTRQAGRKESMVKPLPDHDGLSHSR